MAHQGKILSCNPHLLEVGQQRQLINFGAEEGQFAEQID
jgi:hypothetical protein